MYVREYLKQFVSIIMACDHFLKRKKEKQQKVGREGIREEKFSESVKLEVNFRNSYL